MSDTDNLNFRKPHMTFVDGYFYMFDDDTDMLLQKTDDGVTAFSYPFDTLMGVPINSIEHDGVNFWSMENNDDAVGDDPGTESGVMTIRRWRIHNYACKLQDTLVLSNPSHVFDAETFTVEHYHCTISGGYSAGETIITVDSDDNSLPGELQAGMSVTIGPNNDGDFETIDVQHVVGNIVTLADPLENSYSDGQDFLFYNYIWLFNNYNGTDDSTGALYKISAYSGSVINKTSGGVYKDVKACTFAEIDHFTEFGTVNSLMYVKASNLLFININSSTLAYYGSMAMDTVEADEVTLIDVYDLAVYNKNLYRLQRRANYFGSVEAWSQYNYQAATFNSMVASIGLVVSPNVIAANGVSVADIVARVKDQFAQPVVGRLVYFSVDPNNQGSIVSGQEIVNTDSNGEANSSYTAGTIAELVKLLARVDQV